jgi:hypothetical protein
MNLGDWCEAWGSATFRDNGIGADVLFDLAEADFESWASSWGTAGG